MKLLTTALLTCGLTLAAAGPAAADSIVFIKDKNVWVAGPDGSGARQVTDHTGDGAGFWSPSQADDGTIAVARYQGIELWNRDGTKLKELDPPSLTDSTSAPMDGTVSNVAISPDAKTVAFTYTRYSCPSGVSCGVRQATGYMPTSGSKAPGEYGGNVHLGDPSWVTNSRTLVFGGYDHQVNVHDLGAGNVDQHWFDDWEVVGQENSTDLGDGELSRQGSKLALVRGYGSNTHLMWYSVNGNALTGAPPENPTMVCSGKAEGLAGPTWAPDGDRLAWQEPDGIWTIAATTTSEAQCAAVQPKLTIPGGSEPDWGPAGIGAPKPPVQEQKPPTTTPPPQVGEPGPGTQELVTVELARKLRFKGFSATVTPYAAGTLTAVVKSAGKVVLKGSATAKAAGPVKLLLKPTKAGRKLARKRRKAAAKLHVTFTPGGGKPQTSVESLTLVR